MAGKRPWLVPAVITGGLMPFAAIVMRAASNELGANPIETSLNRLGLVALILLVATLACTPLKLLFGWTTPLRVRRESGLLTFFYATLHVATYTGLDQAFAVKAIIEDIAERPFILVGFLAFVLMIPLAITSRDASVRTLGFKRWKRLHRLTYACAALAVVHFILRVKADFSEPLAYGAAFAIFMILRIVRSGSARGTGPAQR